jgi:hypothetical protein
MKTMGLHRMESRVYLLLSVFVIIASYFRVGIVFRYFIARMRNQVP